jgi:hypothetical protein
VYLENDAGAVDFAQIVDAELDCGRRHWRLR